MAAYRCIVVGTDGSSTSFGAVDRAAAVAADSNAELLIVCAYTPASRNQTAEAEDALGAEAFLVRGSAPAESTLISAKDRAIAAGAGTVNTLAVTGDPVDALRQSAIDAKADLLVVGNRGLNTLSGRILGSVPSDVARRSGIDVLIVHTT